MNERHVLWHCGPLESSEYASLTSHEQGHRLEGIVVLPLDGAPCQIRYEVIVDPGWSANKAVVDITTPSGVRRIELESDGTGGWKRDGAAEPRLSGCSDVDLGWTPATNTVPIRRLDVRVGQTATITAAWVRFPELDVVANEQHYTRLDEDRWQYRAGEYDFELLTDVSSGLVLSYGDDLWQAAAFQ